MPMRFGFRQPSTPEDCLDADPPPGDDVGMEHSTDTATLHRPTEAIEAFATNPPPVAATTPPVADEVPHASQFYRLTVEQYHAMHRADILGEDDPVELLDGWLIRKMTKYSPHTTSTRLVVSGLKPVVPDGWFVISQDPIALAESEPEPDAVIVRGQIRDYAKRHPGPEDIALLIEVADSSLAGDRSWKMRIYARAGVRHYWIINLNDRAVEVYSDPNPETATYRVLRAYVAGESIPLSIDGQVVAEIAVDDLLP